MTAQAIHATAADDEQREGAVVRAGQQVAEVAEVSCHGVAPIAMSSNGVPTRSRRISRLATRARRGGCVCSLFGSSEAADDSGGGVGGDGEVCRCR